MTANLALSLQGERVQRGHCVHRSLLGSAGSISGWEGKNDIDARLAWNGARIVADAIERGGETPPNGDGSDEREPAQRHT